MSFAQPMPDGVSRVVNAPNAPLYPQMQSLSPQQLQTWSAMQPDFGACGPKAPSTVYQPGRPETGRPAWPKFILMNAPANMPLGHKAQQVTCPICNVKVLTKLKYRPTFRTHVMATLFCVTGLICLVPLPYCLKTCRALDHYCSNCGQFVGHVRNG